MFLVNMNFIDIEKVTPELVETHRAYLAKEYEKDLLLFGGRKIPRTGGILLSQHPSEKALRMVLDADPFVQSGAVEYSITEFFPVMAAPSFSHILSA
ncbi:YciI family protein [Thalassotalea fusca]